MPGSPKESGRAKWVLGNAHNQAHIVEMTEHHDFSTRVEPDTSRPGRYRWALYKDKHAYNRSETSFATKREAAAEAAKVLDRRIAAWQAAAAAPDLK